MRLRLAGTAVLVALVIGAPAGQSADIVRTAIGDVTILPLGHGTLALVRGQQLILIDPARFVPGQPDVPREDLAGAGKGLRGEARRTACPSVPGQRA